MGGSWSPDGRRFEICIVAGEPEYRSNGSDYYPGTPDQYVWRLVDRGELGPYLLTSWPRFFPTPEAAEDSIEETQANNETVYFLPVVRNF